VAADAKAGEAEDLQRQRIVQTGLHRQLRPASCGVAGQRFFGTRKGSLAISWTLS
jgi:hypothetical protein